MHRQSINSQTSSHSASSHEHRQHIIEKMKPLDEDEFLPMTPEPKIKKIKPLDDDEFLPMNPAHYYNFPSNSNYL